MWSLTKLEQTIATHTHIYIYEFNVVCLKAMVIIHPMKIKLVKAAIEVDIAL